MSYLLSRKERAVLAASAEPVRDACPECGGWAHIKGGRWRCQAVEHSSLVMKAAGSNVWLACGASGTVMPDGSLAVTRPGVKYSSKEETDG